MGRVLTAALFLMVQVAAQDPAAAPGPAPRLEGFRHVPGKVQVGRVHLYRKSNVDGTNESRIALYQASETRLESLKWHEGEAEATLVVAEMDWPVLSVRSFRTWRIEPSASGALERKLVAEIDASPDRRELVGRLGELTLRCPLERFPWHSYDFDLASLNVTLRYLAEPEGDGEVEIAIVDPVQGPEGPALAARGPVYLVYEESEKHAGLDCRRYAIDGPGLEFRGGKLWAAKGDEVFLAGYEIDLPDEPGMRSGKLAWLENATLTADEWQRFAVERKLPSR
jgi:hypothetical protein